MVEILLATAAVNVNVQDKFGRSPLFMAAANGHSEVVRLLLDHGAKPNPRDKKGRSPFSITKRNYHASTVALVAGHEPTI